MFKQKKIMAVLVVSALLVMAVFTVVFASSSKDVVSTTSSGALSNGASYNVSVSGDARYVVFQSDATNLVPFDTNNVSDIFLKDRTTGTTSRISTSSTQAQSNATSFRPAISYDGRFVVFASDATNLVLNDTNSGRDIFLKNLTTGATTRVSTDSSGNQAIATGPISNGLSDQPKVSGDGNYVVFGSDANNLVANDTNSLEDIFFKNTQTGAITRVSTSSTGSQTTGEGGYI
ncbi:hypothetical protein LCGC14_2562450, partial [marine sediment metagenome]